MTSRVIKWRYYHQQWAAFLVTRNRDWLPWLHLLLLWLHLLLPWLHCISCYHSITSGYHIYTNGYHGTTSSYHGNTSKTNVHLLGSDFGVLSGCDVTLVNHTAEVLSQGLGSAEQPVVLVGRFGEAHHVTPVSDGLLVGHNGVGFLRGGDAN